MAEFGRNRQNLAEFGEIWQNLAEFGRIWQNLAKFDRIWQNLAEFAEVWVRSVFAWLFVCISVYFSVSFCPVVWLLLKLVRKRQGD